MFVYPTLNSMTTKDDIIELEDDSYVLTYFQKKEGSKNGKSDR